MMPTELLSPGIFQMLAAVLVPLIAAGPGETFICWQFQLFRFGGQ